MWMVLVFFFFQAEDGIRDLVRSRGLGDVYKRQGWYDGGPGLEPLHELCSAEAGGNTETAAHKADEHLSLIHI